MLVCDRERGHLDAHVLAAVAHGRRRRRLPPARHVRTLHVNITTRTSPYAALIAFRVDSQSPSKRPGPLPRRRICPAARRKRATAAVSASIINLPRSVLFNAASTRQYPCHSLCRFNFHPLRRALPSRQPGAACGVLRAGTLIRHRPSGGAATGASGSMGSSRTSFSPVQS
jgi:hypothetical protein